MVLFIELIITPFFFSSGGDGVIQGGTMPNITFNLKRNERVKNQDFWYYEGSSFCAEEKNPENGFNMPLKKILLGSEAQAPNQFDIGEKEHVQN